jgi:TetR/AcrR family transcriptional regulator
LESKIRILNAAIRIFAKKGFHGARMEDIGAKAKINKAMVYYYYSNKKNLFQEALNMIVRRIYSEIILGMRDTDTQAEHPVRILEKFVRLHFSAFSKSKEWSKLFVEVLNNHPEYLRTAFLNAFETEKIREHEVIEQTYQRGVAQGIFRDIDFKQVFISIIGMNIIYFLAQPIAEVVLELDIQNEKAFIKTREDSIIDLLLHGVLKEDPSARGG